MPPASRDSKREEQFDASVLVLERKTYAESQIRSAKLAVQERYNQSLFHRVLSGSLQGIAERPLPCNYIVIQLVSALSRRRRGFKSRRGRQLNNLGEKMSTLCLTRRSEVSG